MNKNKFLKLKWPGLQQQPKVNIVDSNTVEKPAIRI